MFDSFGRGWAMAKASWSVLRQHPKLVLFPIISTLAFLALLAVTLASMFTGYLGGDFEGLPATVRPDDPVLYIVGFGFYFASTFTVIFFNAALVFSAIEAFAGRTPTLLGGLGAAGARLPQILAWSLVAATVGMLLNALQSFLRDKLGIIGSLLGGIAEFAWDLMTYFITPVLVVDGVGPIEAVKRSSAILRKTWGESLGGAVSMSVISLVFILPAILVAGLVATLGQSLGVDGVIAFGMTAIVLPYILVLCLVFGTLGTIFRTAAYIYATTGTAPSQMDAALLQNAFRQKKR